MKLFYCFCLAVCALYVIAPSASAESLRCNGDIVEIGDLKADVMTKCGNPEMTDSFCEKIAKEIPKRNGAATVIEDCDNVDVWTYNPGKGQFWTHLYFSHGRLREMRYGDRVQ